MERPAAVATPVRVTQSVTLKVDARMAAVSARAATYISLLTPACKVVHVLLHLSMAHLMPHMPILKISGGTPTAPLWL